MINMDDIMDMTDLTREEIAAVAEHEGLPDVNAAALSEYMMHLHHGPQAVLRMISEDIRAALRRDDVAHARDLYAVLHHFVATHPDAARGADP
ncbi:MAG: hypothetical protein MUF63_14095 [Rhodobacteraceae bacterium]|jgi:hypothetical protein|nr:hypothetical protein [Paracoccaceae bacterium]